jgi:acetyl-CoA C-acetyltransferase
LCSANGGFITKHAVGVYSTEPPDDAFKWGDAQNEADRLTQPRDVAPEDYDGDATIETWTVMHNRDGEPENGIAAALLDDGRRTWGTTQDADVLKAMTVEEFIGRPVRLDGNGTLTF